VRPQGDRVQVFDKMGNFKKNIWIRTGTPTLTRSAGTVWWIGFSRDPEQKFMYVMNGRNEAGARSRSRDREDSVELRPPRHMLGNFTHGHTIAVDSKGNLYIAETDTGRRIQKFSVVSGK